MTNGGTGASNASDARSNLGLGNVENTALSTYTGEEGALDNQYITNGAGYITDGNTNWNNSYGFITNTVTSLTNITSIGTLTSLTVDDITLNGSTISDSGDFAFDIGGDMTIDVDGGDISLQDAGTKWGQLYNSSGNFVIYNPTSDKDIYIRGNDGGSPFNAVHFDMSAGGSAYLVARLLQLTSYLVIYLL